jgi:hypothetical protein
MGPIKDSKLVYVADNSSLASARFGAGIIARRLWECLSAACVNHAGEPDKTKKFGLISCPDAIPSLHELTHHQQPMGGCTKS